MRNSYGNLLNCSCRPFVTLRSYRSIMILFFGTRPGKTELKQLMGVSCLYCEQIGTLTVSKTSNWFHLFWIKLFRISTKIIANCSHCKRAYFEEEFSNEMQESISKMNSDSK